MGKVLAEEMKRYGMSAENDLYEVENRLRELQRQISQAGLAAFFGRADDELHEAVKKRKQQNDYYFHSYDRSHLERLRQGRVLTTRSSLQKHKRKR